MVKWLEGAAGALRVVVRSGAAAGEESESFFSDSAASAAAAAATEGGGAGCASYFLGARRSRTGLLADLTSDPAWCAPAATGLAANEAAA